MAYSKTKSLTSYRALLVFMELALDEPQHQTRLSNSRLSQKHEFKLADFALLGPIGPLCRAAIGHMTFGVGGGLKTRVSVCFSVGKRSKLDLQWKG